MSPVAAGAVVVEGAPAVEVLGVAVVVGAVVGALAPIGIAAVALLPTAGVLLGVAITGAAALPAVGKPGAAAGVPVSVSDPHAALIQSDVTIRCHP